MKILNWNVRVVADSNKDKEFGEHATITIDFSSKEAVEPLTQTIKEAIVRIFEENE